MNKRILGFDCSSETIGWALLETIEISKEINLIECGYIKPIKYGSIIDRLVNTRNKVSDLIKRLLPDYIGIEDILLFMKGKSTANTITLLTAFNRMICLAAYDYLKQSPQLFNVRSIRCSLKIDKIIPKKEDMPELVSKHLGITFPYEMGKKGKLKIENFDIADGIAVALHYAFLVTGKIKAKKVKIKVLAKNKPKSKQKVLKRNSKRDLKIS